MAIEAVRPEPVVDECGFGLCKAPADLEVLVDDDAGALVEVVPVCSLHVSPMLCWGRSEPVDHLRVRELVPAADWSR